MNQNVWGSSFWFTLENIAYNYPIKPTDNDKDNIKKFLECLQYVLPCGICRKNYKMELEQRPIRLNSRKELVYWLFEIHNDVNSRTGKRLYTFEEAVNEYEKKIGGKIELGDNEIHKLRYEISEIDKKFIMIVILLILFIVILLNLKKIKK